MQSAKAFELDDGLMDKAPACARRDTGSNPVHSLLD